MAELISSKVVIVEEPPSIRSLPAIPTGLAAFLGLAEWGPIGSPVFATSFEEYVRTFGSYSTTADMTLAAEDFFKHGGRSAFFTRTVHYTDVTNPATDTAVAASFDIDDRGGAAAPATVQSVTEPFYLQPGDTIDIQFDNNPTQNAVIAATAGAQNNSGTPENYNLVGGETLTVKVNGGPVQTVTFQAGDFAVPGAATAEEVAAAINKALVGAQAYTITGGTEVEIASDTLGTGSSIQVTGGTANAILIFPTAVVSGTGNVVDTTQVTAAEIAAIITALPPAGGGTAVASAGKVTLTSGAVGAAAEIEIMVSTSTFSPVFTVGVYTGSAAGTSPTLRVAGKYKGTRGNNLKAVIVAPTSGNSDEFNLEVQESGITVETFPNLSMTDTAPNYCEEIVNDPNTGSNLVAVTDLDSPASSPNDLPALGTYTLTGGGDGLSGIADVDFIGSQAGETGMYAFDVIQDIAIGPLVPNRCTNAVQNAQLNYAETIRSGSMFVILGTPAGLNKQAVVTYVSTTASLEGASEFGAFYWPRVNIVNPSTNVFGNAQEILVDPVGIIAGVFARTDAAFPGGVYRAPAGLEFGKMQGVTSFETEEVLKEAVRDYIAAHRINPLTSFPGSPRFIDGHDTLKGDGNWPTVPERRGVIFIEQTVKRGMEVYRHSPNDDLTRNSCKRTITAFLLTQLRLRAFRSMDPDKAFKVDVSDQLNPPSDQLAGKLNAKISLATNRPVKWIVLTFSQDVRALEEEIARAESGS